MKQIKCICPKCGRILTFNFTPTCHNEYLDCHFKCSFCSFKTRTFDGKSLLQIEKQLIKEYNIKTIEEDNPIRQYTTKKETLLDIAGQIGTTYDAEKYFFYINRIRTEENDELEIKIVDKNAYLSEFIITLTITEVDDLVKLLDILVHNFC